MLYREIAPRGAAAQFVKCFWTLEDDVPSSEPQRVLPDGRCELIFNLAEPFESQSSCGWVRQPKSFLVGQITSPMLLRSTGPARILGLRFHPHGAAQLFGCSADEIAGQQIPLEALSPHFAKQLDPLQESASLSDQVARFQSVINSVGGKYGQDRAITIAAAEFERTAGSTSIRQMANQLGISMRQFERRFKRAIGMSPKLFCRIQRVQRVLRAMDDPGLDWVGIALDCGYYDQSHLIRDFQAFAGDPPTALLTQELSLSRHFSR